MQIKRRLSLIIIGVISAVLIGIGIFVLIYIPTVRMNREKDTLFMLDSAISELRADVNKFPSTSFDSQLEIIIEKNDILKSQFDRIDNFKDLKRDEDIEEVLGIIHRLFTLYEVNYERLIGSADKISPELEKVFFSNKLKLYDVSTSKMLDRAEDKDYLIGLINDLFSTISIIDSNLVSTHMVVEEQFAVIDSIIKTRENQSYIFGIVVIILISIVGFIFALITTSRIAKNIRLAAMGIAGITSGDLSVRFEIATRDELGELGRDLNLLTDNLKQVFQFMKTSSNRGVELKEELITSAEQTSAAASEIAANSQAISHQFSQLSERVAGASEVNQSLKDGLHSLEGYVQEQMAMVEESTSAVTEMISSINNVSDITEKKRAATDILVRTAETGGAKLGATIKVINEINESLDQIKGAATIIQQIASQTNLLAMNAAIEAAHAGDAGRGFAVVADEIRKLAEASSVNSKQINGVIKEVVNRIEIASESGTETEKAFTEIDREVEGVAQSFDEISSSMSELNIGGKQILEAMTGLQDVSVNVNQGSRDMTEGSAKVTEAIDVVTRITSEVANSAQEITLGITEVSDAMMQVTELSGNLGEITDTLEQEAARFKTDDAAVRTEGDITAVESTDEEAVSEKAAGDDVSEVTISGDNEALDIESMDEL